ncbi:MAG TPA: hypothetical protein VEY70_01510 [Metabacillus sp.]|nr:hypothetical protein [Metabacillus sp.]
MKKVQFLVEAKKYFAVDAERLEQAKEDDLCLVTIDFEKQKVGYIWYGAGENPANFPEEKDDFEGVVALWEELGRPGE